jgi:hypothetical protein
VRLELLLVDGIRSLAIANQNPRLERLRGLGRSERNRAKNGTGSCGEGEAAKQTFSHD